MTPTSGTTATTFHFSVVYSDQYVPPPARPAPCVSVTITNTVTLAVMGPFTMTAPGGVPPIGSAAMKAGFPFTYSRNLPAGTYTVRLQSRTGRKLYEAIISGNTHADQRDRSNPNTETDAQANPEANAQAHAQADAQANPSADAKAHAEANAGPDSHPGRDPRPDPDPDDRDGRANTQPKLG